MFRIACYVVMAVGLLNFVACWLGAMAIGGDALHGFEQGGRYFVRIQRQVTEVSEAVFTYSKWHTRSLFITHPLAILAGFLLYLEQRRSK